MKKGKKKSKFPRWAKILLGVVLVLAILIGGVWSVMVPYVNYNTGIDWDTLESENVTLNYPVFDGTQV